MLVVGSQALAERGLLQVGRRVNDLDLITTKEEASAILRSYSEKGYKPETTKFGFYIKTGKEIIEVDTSNSSQELLNIVNATSGKHIASLDVLYTLKMSHRYLKDSPHFLKTMHDIKYLRKLGAKVPDNLQEWFKKREKETYDYQHPKLNVDKEDFFDKAEDFYVYDHDSIHMAVALRDYPAYLDFKPSNEDVLCSREMFEDCSDQVKLNSVVEEAMVLTLERSLVPNDFKPDPDKMFKFALTKVCSSITSGWWREYAWEHFEEAMKLFNSLGGGQFIVNSFNNNFSLVKPFSGTKY